MRFQSSDRRSFLSGAGKAALAGSAALALAPQAAANPASLIHGMWTHGTSIQVEFTDQINSIVRRGFHTRIEAKPGNNWFHFAIPTPVIVSDRRLRIDSVMLKFSTGDQATVTNVHVYDGPDRIAALDNLRLTHDHPFERFAVAGHPEVHWGIGISVGASFGVDPDRWMQFSSAGADFI